MRPYLLLAFIIPFLLCCNEDDEPGTTSVLSIDSTIFNRLDSINPDFEAIYDVETGIYSERIDSNIISGDATGDIYAFTYVLSLPSGIVVENGRDTVLARVGANAIYPFGIDQVIQGKRPGESWKFVIPSSLCFNNYQGDNLIPAETDLEFELHVIDTYVESDISMQDFSYLESYTKDTLNFPNGDLPLRFTVDGLTDFYKKVIQEGTGVSPTLGSVVEFTYIATSLPDSITFDTGELTIDFEAGQVISGLYNALGSMKQGETAQVFMPSAAGYGFSARIFPNIVNDGNAYKPLEDFLLDPTNQIIPTYASKIEPYKMLWFEITLRSVL